MDYGNTDEDSEFCFWKEFYERYYPETKNVVISVGKGFSHLERLCQDCDGYNYNCEAYNPIKDLKIDYINLRKKEDEPNSS
jgi:hypothetical protein